MVNCKWLDHGYTLRANCKNSVSFRTHTHTHSEFHTICVLQMNLEFLIEIVNMYYTKCRFVDGTDLGS